MTQPSFAALHPKWPAGSPNGQGGKFMPKHMAGSAIWAQQVSAAIATQRPRQAKSAKAATPPVPAAPPPTPPSIRFTRAAVPAGAPPGTKGKLEYWVDYDGTAHGPYPSRIAANKAVPKIALGPHKVHLGKDLIKVDGQEHPNRIASAIAKARPPGAAPSTHRYARGKFVRTTPGTADVDLRLLADRQGFSGVPEIVTQAEMNKLAKAGNHYILYRGTRGSFDPVRGHHVTASTKQADFRSGEAFFGLGVYGNGYYFSTVRREAVGYSDHTQGSIVRVALPKTAKIIGYNAAQAEVAKLVGHRAASQDTKEVFADVGRWAVAKGYAAIRVDSFGSSYHVLLNRSILKVQDK